MGVRARVQRSALLRASRVIVPSEIFGDLIAADCGVNVARIHVVPNVIDTRRFTPADSAGGARRPAGKVRLVFVGRIAVRKGIELVVELSHRIDDLGDRAEIHIVGNWSTWSDYRPLLATLNPRTTQYLGAMTGPEVAAVLRDADVLLCPSHYEPFGLTVAEALASGLHIIASSQVGAAEHIASSATIFRAGSIEDLERVTRGVVACEDIGSAERRLSAREEAEQLFGRAAVLPCLQSALAAT
jgi:glycosyltransferase involved in cell wall biosynthesis